MTNERARVEAVSLLALSLFSSSQLQKSILYLGLDGIWGDPQARGPLDFDELRAREGLEQALAVAGASGRGGAGQREREPARERELPEGRGAQGQLLLAAVGGSDKSSGRGGHVVDVKGQDAAAQSVGVGIG